MPSRLCERLVRRNRAFSDTKLPVRNPSLPERADALPNTERFLWRIRASLGEDLANHLLLLDPRKTLF